MRISNLDYMKSHSPNNPKFVVEMVTMILEQTPPYFMQMQNALTNSDWTSLHSIMHKIRPSIDLIGMPKEIGIIAKEIESYCKELVHLDLIPALYLKVDTAFKQAYPELEEELKQINIIPN
jgi:HPt (histidine-containing phosphotransfer) domain-containing protein